MRSPPPKPRASLSGCVAAVLILLGALGGVAIARDELSRIAEHHRAEAGLLAIVLSFVALAFAGVWIAFK